MILRKSRNAVLAVLAFLFTAWAASALAIDGPFAGAAATALAVAWLLLPVVGILVFGADRRALALVLVLDLGVVVWWRGLEPRNDRHWIPEVENAAIADFGQVTLHNVRNFEWRSDTDFTPHWEDRTYDLSKIRAADMFISYWGPTVIAHTIMSWEFEDGRHLAISIETRKEVGEEYSATLGFFRQFELYYVVADERDVVALRTNVRGETVYLYRLSASPQSARALLLDYLESINRVAAKPKWYNALTQNCTTTIFSHARNIDRNLAWDWRILANGSLDALLYMWGSTDNSIPFVELRERSNITEAAKAAGRAEDFSARIREGRPRMTPAR